MTVFLSVCVVLAFLLVLAWFCAWFSHWRMCRSIPPRSLTITEWLATADTDLYGDVEVFLASYDAGRQATYWDAMCERVHEELPTTVVSAIGLPGIHWMRPLPRNEEEL